MGEDGRRLLPVLGEGWDDEGIEDPGIAGTEVGAEQPGPEGECQCEHEDHSTPPYFGHQEFHTMPDVKSVESAYGPYDVCGYCRESGHMGPYENEDDPWQCPGCDKWTKRFSCPNCNRSA